MLKSVCEYDFFLTIRLSDVYRYDYIVYNIKIKHIENLKTYEKHTENIKVKEVIHLFTLISYDVKFQVFIEMKMIYESKKLYKVINCFERMGLLADSLS